MAQRTAARRQTAPIYEAEELDVLTPRVTAVWPRLNEPDYEYKAEGEYSVNVVLDPEIPEQKTLLDQIEEFTDNCHANACRELGKNMDKHSPIRAQEEDGEPTGRFLLRAKMKAEVTPKGRPGWTQRPKLFDSQGKPLAPTERIGSGSEVRVRATARSWVSPIGAGVGLRLLGVQVIELVEPRVGATAEDMGFEAVENGFVTDVEFDAVDTTRRAAKGNGDF